MQERKTRRTLALALLVLALPLAGASAQRVDEGDPPPRGPIFGQDPEPLPRNPCDEAVPYETGPALDCYVGIHPIERPVVPTPPPEDDPCNPLAPPGFIGSDPCGRNKPVPEPPPVKEPTPEPPPVKDPTPEPPPVEVVAPAPRPKAPRIVEITKQNVLHGPLNWLYKALQKKLATKGIRIDGQGHILPAPGSGLKVVRSRTVDDLHPSWYAWMAKYAQSKGFLNPTSGRPYMVAPRGQAARLRALVQAR